METRFFGSVFTSLVVVWFSTVLLSVAGAQDVDWLGRVTTPPARYALESPGVVEPLLVDSHGRRIEFWDQWWEHRRGLQERWRAFLGPMPEDRSAIRVEVLQSERVSGSDATGVEVVRQWVRYEGEPGVMVDAYVLIPAEAMAREAALPGIVALHATTPASNDEIAGLGGPDSARIGLKLAQRGYVVVCPRCFLWQDVMSFEEAVAKHRARHPSTTGMAKMLYDAVRGVDLLVSLPYVDRRRIGAVGHSLGAKEVLYLMAFDERVRAGVASEGGLGLRSTNWNAPWYLGSAIEDPSFALNHHQLLAMIAPRPLLILGGESGPGAADGNRSWHLLAPAAAVWSLQGGPVRLGMWNHGQGHALSDEAFEKMAQWMEAYVLRAEASPRSREQRTGQRPGG